MKAQILIRPTPTKDEPEQHMLYLKVGNQSFGVNGEMEDIETARWTAEQLRKALVNAGADVTKRSTLLKRIP